MNLTLFQSLWAVTGMFISAAFVGWLYLADAEAGARKGSNVTILLWSGWVTFALMVFVCVYALRKYVHKLGISPEFKMKVTFEKLEQAERELNDVRRLILSGLLKKRAEIEAEATAILRRTGVTKVCRATVVDGDAGCPFYIRVVPTEPLGRMRKWLHFHVYLGLASGVTLWVHGGASMASPMGILMNGLTAIVLITGVIGTFLYALGPKWMTRAEKDMNFEDAFVLEQSLKKKIKVAYEALKPEQVKVFKRAEKSGTLVVQRTALQEVVALEPAQKREMEDVMVLVAQRRRILEDLKGAARIKWWINIWRVVHVPASIALLGVSLVHIVSVIWY